MRRITYLLLILSIALSSCTIQKRKYLSGYDVRWTGKTHMAKANRIKKDKGSDISSAPKFEINQQPFDSTTELKKSNDLLADKNNFQRSKIEKKSYKLPNKSFKKEQVRSKYRKWKKRILPRASEDNSSSRSGSSGNTLAILGLVFTIVGLLLWPLFIVGGILSIIAWSQGSTLGKVMSIIFIVFMALFVVAVVLVLLGDGTFYVGV